MTLFSVQNNLAEKNVVVDDAPAWLRTIIFSQAIEGVLYIDRSDDAFGGAFQTWDQHRRPIPIKGLSEWLAMKTQSSPPVGYDSSSFCIDALKRQINGLPWYIFFDLLQVVGENLHNADKANGTQFAQTFQQRVNLCFSNGSVGWRFTPDFAFERLKSEEVSKLEKSLTVVQGDTVSAHLKKARGFLNKRPVDAANAIKESVSAIECSVRTICPRSSTLGAAVRLMKKTSDVPPLLLSAIEKLYAFASDEPGVRHGSPVGESVERADAELVYVTAMALIEYLKIKEN